jgi:small-conductance mechanosensitive channel
LLFLLACGAFSIALYLTTFDDKLIDRLQVFDHVLVTVSAGWLAIGIARAIAHWLEERYAQQNMRDALGARRFSTQIHVLQRVAIAAILALTVISVALIIPGLRQFGVSLFASAGVAGLVIGMAANSTLSNLIAGVQIAITQPILLGDEVFINNLTGRVEEIRASFLVIKLEDARRMIIPFNWFMSNPIVNSTYEGQSVMSSITFEAPAAIDVDQVRLRLEAVSKDSKYWDGKTCKLLVGDAKSQSVTLRIQLSARNSSDMAQLQSDIRQRVLLPLLQQKKAA